jgi:hypothetical protein
VPAGRRLLRLPGEPSCGVAARQRGQDPREREPDPGPDGERRGGRVLG